MNRNLVMSEPLVVVIDNPPFLTSTQVQNVPHLGDRGPMTCSKELKPRSEDSKDNCPCVFLFLRVSKNEMLDGRV